MPIHATAKIYASHNDLIEANRDSTEGDGHFWSLCRPRYTQKSRTCLKCGRSFKSASNAHRHCANCGSVSGPKKRRVV